MSHARRGGGRRQLTRLGSTPMVVAGLLFALTGVFVKLGSRELSGAEVVWLAMSLVVCGGIMAAEVTSGAQPRWRAPDHPPCKGTAP